MLRFNRSDFEFYFKDGKREAKHEKRSASKEVICVYVQSSQSHKLSSCSGSDMNCCNESQVSSCGSRCMPMADVVLCNCILMFLIFQLLSEKGSRIKPNTDSKTPTEQDAWVCRVPQLRIKTIPWCSILKIFEVLVSEHFCDISSATHFPRVPSYETFGLK